MRTSGKTNSPGQVRGSRKTCKKKSHNWATCLSSLCFFWVCQLPHLQDVFSFICQIKLSCNTSQSWSTHHFKYFAAARQYRGNYKLSRHMCCHFSDLTWLKQPQLSPWEVGAKHSRSPTWQKLPWWKLNMKKAQHSGSDKKARVVETWTAKTNSAESPRGSLSDSRRPPVGVGSPCLYGWKDIWLTKS